jgi:hypothetical protein
MDGNEVGVIDSNDSASVQSWCPELAGKTTVRLIVPASEACLKRNPNCPWMWVRIKETFTDGEQAKAWVREHSDYVIGRVYVIKAEGVTA